MPLKLPDSAIVTTPLNNLPSPISGSSLIVEEIEGDLDDIQVILNNFVTPINEYGVKLDAINVALENLGIQLGLFYTVLTNLETKLNIPSSWDIISISVTPSWTTLSPSPCKEVQLENISNIDVELRKAGGTAILLLAAGYSRELKYITNLSELEVRVRDGNSYTVEIIAQLLI